MRNKVFVIALDGGSFNLLQPWIDEGELPNIRGIIKEGISGELKSTMPPTTAPAWNSFMTGMNPGKHGIFDFVMRDRNDYRYHVVSSYDRRSRTIWDIVGQNGGKVVVLNVPTTYPPDKVQGVQVSGFLTPAGKRDFVHPPELLPEIEDKFGEYPLSPKSPSYVINLRDSYMEDFLIECLDILDYKFEVAHYLANKLDPDFLMLHVMGGDYICHWLWHIIDEDHPWHKRDDFIKHGDRILDYFREFDAKLGKLSAEIDENTSLFVISDHGFGPVHRMIDMNVWLYREGYLALKSSPLTRLRQAFWELGLTHEFLYRNIHARLFRYGFKPTADIRRSGETAEIAYSRKSPVSLLTIGDVDWSRTKAFCGNVEIGASSITINLKGRCPQGCVSAGPDYENLRNEIVNKLRELRDSETGSLINGEVLTKEEVYNGRHLDDAPDVIFWAMNNKYVIGSLFGFSSNKVVTNPWIRMTGHHTTNGILIGKGRAVRQGLRIRDAKMVDLAPTILYMMGLKIPRDMDGKVLEEMFTEEFRQSHNIEFTDVATREDKESEGMTPEERELVMQRLKALGYIA